MFGLSKKERELWAKEQQEYLDSIPEEYRDDFENPPDYEGYYDDDPLAWLCVLLVVLPVVALILSFIL